MTPPKYSITLTEQELQNLMGLLEAGLKAIGGPAARPYLELETVIAKAVQDARGAATKTIKDEKTEDKNR